MERHNDKPLGTVNSPKKDPTSKPIQQRSPAQHNKRIAPTHWFKTRHYLYSRKRGTRRVKALSSILLSRYARPLGTIPRNVFYFNRHTVAKAALIGLFVAMLPIPMQMLVAACASVMFSAYLPMAVCLVWVSNPLTYIPLLWATYTVGNLLIGLGITDNTTPLTFADLSSNPLALVVDVWLPVIVGCLTIGTTLGITAYCLTHYLWRVNVLKRWHSRHCISRSKCS